MIGYVELGEISIMTGVWRGSKLSAEIDDRCPMCESQCTFSTKVIQGHAQRHRIATCPKCGDEVTGMCSGCWQLKN